MGCIFFQETCCLAISLAVIIKPHIRELYVCINDATQQIRHLPVTCATIKLQSLTVSLDTSKHMKNRVHLNVAAVHLLESPGKCL